MEKETKVCRYCSEEIAVNAKLCKHCGKHTARFRVGFRGWIILAIITVIIVATAFGEKPEEPNYEAEACAYSQKEIEKEVEFGSTVKHPPCSVGKVTKGFIDTYFFSSYINVKNINDRNETRDYKCSIKFDSRSYYTANCTVGEVNIDE